VREREAATARADEEKRTEAVPPLPRHHVLELQRTAGNAAVSGWLARDRKLPAEPHSLGDIGDVAHELQIDEDAVSISGRARYFRIPRLPARPGFWVETRFGGDMATDPKKEEAVRNGLGSIGLIMFGLNGDEPKDPKSTPDPDMAPPPKTTAKPRPATVDIVHLQDMDLTDHGGKDGRYRFAAVKRKAGSGGAKTEVDIIIELLGARRPAFKTAAQLDSKRRSELEARFTRLGFKRAQDQPDVLVDKWDADQWFRLLQAIEAMPEDMLTGVPGIVWERGHGSKSDKGESGHYDTKTGLTATDKPDRRLQIFDEAFNSDDALLKVVAHELGHAVSNKPAERGGTALSDVVNDYRKEALADGQHAITKYGDTKWAEHYADAYEMFIAEKETMKVMRPKTFAWFQKQQDAAKPPAPTKPAAPAKKP
jgi:hypothetical protein